MKTNKNWFSIVSAVMLLLAIPTIWPYGYFQILRWIVTITAVHNIYLAYKTKQNGWIFIMGVIALLFNPVSPIYFEKATWVVFDLVTSILMFVSVFKSKKLDGS